MTSSMPGEVTRASAARSEWTRRDERGSAVMLRVMTWISLRLGRRVGRCVLPLIAAYFVAFAGSARRASRRYLGRALGRDPGWGDVYRHIHAFASTIHDRLYFINDRFELFDIEVRGGELITGLLAQGRGAFLMGAHLGSFEVLRALARENLDLDVAMVMYEENARKINAALAAVNPAAQQEIIPLGRPDSMLRVRQRLQQGAIVGILGDRSLGDDAVLPVSFLGAPATLPTGPFRMAALLRQPVIFMAGLYLGSNRYRIHFEALADFSATLPTGREAAQREAIAKFAATLDRHCREAPYNWFNFYDFWAPSAPAEGAPKAGR
jgi:predicted LPLAT superfamily acyltransferase